MNEKFYEQKKEKQDLMINGAMRVFARNGYRNASTDDMVKVSGVSKGLWFHYFENKKGLYQFVAVYGIKYALLELELGIDETETDYFKIMQAMEEVKMKLMEKYPDIPLLLIRLEEEDQESKAMISDVLDSYRDKVMEIMSRADLKPFKNKADTEMLRHMIQATFQKIMKEYYEQPVFQKKMYLEETQKYLTMLREISYR